MKKVYCLSVFLCLTVSVIGQVSDTTLNSKPVRQLRVLQANSLYLEIGGNAMIVSVNYERLLVRDGRFYLTGRGGLGMGTYIRGMSNNDFLAIPLLLNFQSQLSNVVLLEFGLGSTLSFVPSYHYFNALITGIIGVKVQSKSGFLFKAGFTPLFSLDDTFSMWGFDTFSPGAGISLGYCFGK